MSSPPGDPVNDGFDSWLDSELHRALGPVTREPAPASRLRAPGWRLAPRTLFRGLVATAGAKALAGGAAAVLAAGALTGVAVSSVHHGGGVPAPAASSSPAPGHAPAGHVAAGSAPASPGATPGSDGRGNGDLGAGRAGAPGQTGVLPGQGQARGHQAGHGTADPGAQGDGQPSPPSSPASKGH